jgi:hypothetical protein
MIEVQNNKSRPWRELIEVGGRRGTRNLFRQAAKEMGEQNNCSSFRACAKGRIHDAQLRIGE